MKFIYKYRLSLSGTDLVTMPANSKVLSVEQQDDHPVLYVLVREDELKTSVVRHFRVAMTGEAIEDLDPSSFLGTAMLQGGQFVVHVFEVTPSELSGWVRP